ncbi:MAG TPA: polymer-forming cytoskeletal protein [Terriglobia bacterium]|nr:polymer-forming cytoskeletal protein [Terriglobia bacterium]
MSEPTPKLTNPTPKSTNPPVAGSPHTLLGRTVVVQGQLSAGEDLLIEGQYEGTIHLDDHCLTVGTEGHVKAEIRARQVVILGSVAGNVAAREKVEIRRTGHVVGDLVAATVAIEEGAYFKGSIDIAREDGSEAAHDVAAPSTLKTNA